MELIPPSIAATRMTLLTLASLLPCPFLSLPGVWGRAPKQDLSQALPQEIQPKV